MWYFALTLTLTLIISLFIRYPLPQFNSLSSIESKHGIKYELIEMSFTLPIYEWNILVVAENLDLLLCCRML